MWTLFFEFELPDPDRFSQLQRLFYALAQAKSQETLIPDDPNWMDYFTEEQIQQFWWPTAEEILEYTRIWESLPVEQRWNDPRLQHPWDFESWLDALANAEYELSSLEQAWSGRGRLEFQTWSHPYGSADALRFLLQVFGAHVTREDV